MRRCLINRARLAGSIALVGLLATACSGGVNAGEDGGIAFILFTVMLLAVVGVMAFILGRED
ncbi:MAG: hypothetical protein M3346_07070 [Actinomycetota bacterium]|nr:hypothetical protein [Actinomycetota bacterium]